MQLDYEIADHLGEAKHPGGFRRAQDQIIVANKQMLPKLDRAGQRAQHPKVHATLRAQFTTRDLGENHKALQVGVFATPGQRRDALIRFSNSNKLVDNPKGGDAHGMAIKVLGVEGEKFEPDPHGAAEGGTHDFILLNNETFFDGQLNRYTKLNRLSGDLFSFLRNGRPRLKGLIALARVLTMINVFDPKLGQAIGDTSDQFPVSPLLETFFSTTPYLLGPDHAVKYLVRPVIDPGLATTRQTPDSDENYLNKTIRQRLLSAEHRFVFSAQIKRPGQHAFSIEDPSRAWDQAETVDLADIFLPKLEDASDAAWQAIRFAEETRRYNIWNARAEHRPLGVLNRLRREVYKELGRTRTDLDGDVYG